MMICSFAASIGRGLKSKIITNTMLIVSISLSLIMVTTAAAATAVKAVTTNNNNFIKYDNPKFGIEIQYPANWAKEVTDDEDFRDVTFLVPRSPIKFGEKLSLMISDKYGTLLPTIQKMTDSFQIK